MATQIFFHFHLDLYLGKKITHFDDHIFSKGLVQPSTREEWIEKLKTFGARGISGIALFGGSPLYLGERKCQISSSGCQGGNKARTTMIPILAMGTHNPSFRGYKGLKNLHVSWFLGPRVKGILPNARLDLQAFFYLCTVSVGAWKRITCPVLSTKQPHVFWPFCQNLNSQLPTLYQ